MNTRYIEQKQQQIIAETHKKAKNRLLLAMLTCCLFLLLQIAFAFISLPMYKGLCSIFGLDSENPEIATLFDILIYVLNMVIPFGIMALVIRYSKGFRSLPSPNGTYSPKMPFLYLFGTVGASYIINLLVSVISGNLFDRFDFEIPPMPESPLGIILSFIHIAVLPALLEEWAFRGLIFKSLRPYGKWGAVIISSLMFGIMHIDPRRIIFATLFGTALSLCCEATGSIKFGILIHMLNNSISVGISYAFQFESDAVVIYNMLVFLFMGIGIAAVIYYSLKGINRIHLSVDFPLDQGYSLPLPKYLSAAALNFGIIPLIILYGVTFYMSYFM